MNEFLTKFGLPQGGMIRCDEGGELSRSQKFREKVLEFHYICSRWLAGVVEFENLLPKLLRAR